MTSSQAGPSRSLLRRWRNGFAGNYLARGAGYLTIVQIVRLLILLMSTSIVLRHFGPTSYGLITIAQALFEALLNLQVQVGQAVQTFIPQLLVKKKAAAVRLVLWSGYALRALSFGSLGIILIIASPWVGDFYHKSELGGLVLILGVNALLRILSGPVDLNVLFGLTRYKAIGIQNILEISGTLLAALATWLLDLSPAGYLWAMTFFLLPGYLFCWLQYPVIARALAWRDNDPGEETLRSWFVTLFRFGLPVSAAAFLYQASLQIGILVVGKFFSSELVGQFGFAVNAARRGWNLISYLETLLLSHFAKAYAVGQSALERATIVYGGMMFALSLSAAVPIVLFAREVTLLLAGPQYLPAVSLLQMLSFQFLFRGYEYLRFASYADHRTERQLIATGIKIVSELLLIALLLPAFGLVGIAAAHLLSFLICSGYIVWAASKVIVAQAEVPAMILYQAKTAVCGIIILAAAMFLANALGDAMALLSWGLRGLFAMGVLTGTLMFVRLARARAALLPASS